MSQNKSKIVISRKESCREIYILPKFPDEDLSGPCEVDLDLVIVPSNKKDVSGYKAKICPKTLIVSSLRLEEKSESHSRILEEVKKALFETDDYSFEIVNEGLTSENFIVLLSDQEEKIVSVPLQKISSSEALDVFVSITSIMLKENEWKTSNWESKFFESEEKVKSAEDKFRKLIIEKNLMEDHMYRAFHKCLNAKKDRIKQLLDEPNKKKSVTLALPDKPTRSYPTKKSKKPRVLDSSDSDSVSEHEDKKSEHSSEFDFDTDTDTEMSVAPKPKKDLLFGSQKPNLNLVAKLEDSSPSDSQNDSFVDFPVTRKLRSTNNQLKLNCKVTSEKRSYADEEFNDETNHTTVDERKESHSPKKQQKIVEVIDLEVMYDCDKLMDEI